MSEELETTDKQSGNSKPWQFKPGESGNPKGRPKGKTMKEFAREFLMSMTDENKLEFLNSLSKDVVWKMAEGNPATQTDITSAGKPIPIFGNVPANNSNEQDSEAHKED